MNWVLILATTLVLSGLLAGGLLLVDRMFLRRRLQKSEARRAKLEREVAGVTRDAQLRVGDGRSDGEIREHTTDPEV
jgi:C4-dicarboxylate-specific signal transduction histidine kinase